MLRERLGQLRFGLKSLFVLMLGMAIGLTIDKWPSAQLSNNPPTWNLLGLDLSEEPRSTFVGKSSRYRGGMHVDRVRSNSAAAKEGIQPGDIIVGIQKWETACNGDIEYVMSRLAQPQQGKIKFYLLRGQNTLCGNLDVVAAR